MKLKNLLELLILFAIFGTFFLASCTKEVPKELLNSNKQGPTGNKEMPDDSFHKNMKQGSQQQEMTESDSKQDQEKADKLLKEADDADAKYQKTKSDADKKVCIEKQMDAANFMMLEANLSPKKKYRTALKRYRRVLELDPKNDEAAQNKKMIEDIYQQMGMPIPD